LANSKPTQAGTRRAAKHGSIKRHAFATVLVLVAVFPLAIFAFTHWINQSAVSRTLDDRLMRSVRNAGALRSEVERSLSMARRIGLLDVQDAHVSLPDGTAVYETYITPALRKTLEQIEPMDPMLSFATLLNSRGNVIAWFGEQGQLPRHGDIQVMADDSTSTLVRKIRLLANPAQRQIVTLAYPAMIDQRIVGTLVVGLSFHRINKQIEEEVSTNNRRALSTSLAGSLLLAALGAYLLKLNDRARTLQSALEREKHLAYIGTLSAGLAHEIRNPLSSVKMNVQMIRNKLAKTELEDKENLLRKIERVNHEVDRLDKSISDFLVFAAPRPLNRKPASLNAVVASAIDFARKADGSAQVATLLDPDLPPVEIDEDMFVEMLQNLLINAQHAAGPGGKVEVETLLERGFAVVAVSDSGSGVPEKDREKVFEVFFTTKKGGTGLGLNIARRIAEDHGGTIEIGVSTLGGARFAVRLPLGSASPGSRLSVAPHPGQQGNTR